MAEAMRDEVAAGSAEPAKDVQVDSAGAYTEDAASGKSPVAVSAAGHEQQPATVITEAGEPVATTTPEAKAPKSDEVRRSAERASESEGQMGNAAKKDQGTSLQGGKADLKGEMGAAVTRRAEDTEGAADTKTKAPKTAAVEETVAPDRQAVHVMHSDKIISSAAHSVPSGNEEEDGPLCYELFWRANEREVISSEKRGKPRPPACASRQEPTRSGRSKKKEVETPSVTFQNQPTKVEKVAEHTNVQEIVDNTVAEFQVCRKSSDLDTNIKADSTLSNRGEHSVAKGQVSENFINEQQSGTLESIAVVAGAIDSTTEDVYKATPMSLSGHENYDIEAEATIKTAKREVTSGKLVPTSATSFSSSTQAGAYESTSGSFPNEPTDGKPEAEKKGPKNHGRTTKTPEKVVEIEGLLSSGSTEAKSTSLRPGTKAKELESMTETSEATLKIIQLSESLSDKMSANKAEKIEQLKQTSKLFQTGEGTGESELSAGVQKDTVGASLEGSELSQASAVSKMENTSEASKAKSPISKKSKRPLKMQKSSMESTNANSAAQKPTEKTPSSEMVRKDDTCGEQIPTKAPERTDSTDQIRRKQSEQKPTKTTKKDSLRKQETVSGPSDVNIGAIVDTKATANDIHSPKTGTEASATVSKEGSSSENATFPKTISGQKSVSKDIKTQPRRKKGVTQPADANKPTVSIAESVIEPPRATMTDGDESSVLAPSECTEVSSKGAPVDGMNAKAPFQKTSGPQMPKSKKTRKTVPKTGSSSALASGPQRLEDTVAPVTGSSTTKPPTSTESVSSVTTKKDVTKTESDNVKEIQKRNIKATKTQQTKGKSFAAIAKSGSKTPQQAERISDQNAAMAVREDVAEVKTVAESDTINKKPAKTYPSRKLSNKTTKATAKKSDAGGSQKDICSTQEASLRTEYVSGASTTTDENISSSKILSDQEKSNTKTDKDQMKPADSASGAEKKTVKATELDKNETLPSSAVIQHENNSVQIAESTTHPREDDPNSSREETRKNTKLTQKKPERRSAPVKENKRKSTVKSNEKEPAGIAQNEVSGDNSGTKSSGMQVSASKAEGTNSNAQTPSSRTPERNPNRNIDIPPANTVESEEKDIVSDRPVVPTETSPESIVNSETATVRAAANTVKQILTTAVADKIVTEVSTRKTPSSRKNTRKEKALLKKLEEVHEHSEKEPSTRKDNEMSTSTSTDQYGIDSIQKGGTDIELESTESAAKTVGAKTRVPKSPSDLKRKRNGANAQLKKSCSMVAISKSKSKTTVVVGRAKLPLSGDTELTTAKTMSLKKSESFTATATDTVKRQSAEGKGIIASNRQQISSLKQKSICREQGRMQTSASQVKNTKENDSGLVLQHASSKPISSFTKEGTTESNVPVVFEASESALKDDKKREEKKQLVTVSSDEGDASSKSPRKTKADQNPKAKEVVQNTGTDKVDRPTKIHSKAAQEKSVESAETALLPPDGKPASPRSRRPKQTQTPEETKGILESKAPNAGENTSEAVKDVTEEKSRTTRKVENVPISGLQKHGNSPRKRTDEDVAAEAKQRTICTKHETRTNDKLNDVDSTQKNPGQVKHESVPTTVTVTLKAGDRKGTNKSAGDTARTGKTVECTISTKAEAGEANRSSEVGRSADVAKKEDQRSSKPREKTGQTSIEEEKIAASGPPIVTGDGVSVGSPRKQTADRKDAKAKAKNIDGLCVVIEEIPQEQKSKSLGKAETDHHEKQLVGTNQEQLTSTKDTGQPQSSPRKSSKVVSKTAPASNFKSEVPCQINSLDKGETKGTARIAIVEIEEIKDVPPSIREKQKSSTPGGMSTLGDTKYNRTVDSTKAAEMSSAREPNPSPRLKQVAVKKRLVSVPSSRACEHSEDNVAGVVTQLTSKTDTVNPKHDGSNGSENVRSTSPQRLIAQLRTFMTQASLLHKLDLKSKILECMGVNEVRDGYKIAASHGKIKASTDDVVTDLQKVAAALKVGRKRLEDQATSKVLEKDKLMSMRIEESRAKSNKGLLGVITARTDVGRAEEARNKLIGKSRSLRSDKHKDRKSTTASSGWSSSSDTPRPILVKDRARKRKARTERKGGPRVRFSDTTSGLTTPSSRPSYSHGGRRQRWASATPEIPERVKNASPLRHGGGTGPKFPVGIVSSTMLALKRMSPSSIEKRRPVSPRASRGSSKPLPSAAAAVMAVTMKAREIAKVGRHETKAAAERRSRSPRTDSVMKRATTREPDKKRKWKPEERAGEIVIRGLSAAAANFPAAARMEEGMTDFSPVPHARKQRERSAEEYDRTPVIAQTYSEADNTVSPRKGVGRPVEKVMPSWQSASYTTSPAPKSNRSPTSEKSPTLHVLHDNKRSVRTKTTVINSSPTEVPCSVAITKKTSVPAPTGKRPHQSSRTTRKGAAAARGSIEHVVNIDIRMGSLSKDATASGDGRGRTEAPLPKNAVVTKDSSVGTEEMQVLDVRIRELPAAGDEGELDDTSVQTLMRAKQKSETGGGDVDDAACDSSDSMLALAEPQAGAAGDRLTGYGEGDEDSGAESDASSKTWPRATLVTPTTKTLAASFPRFSTSSVPEEAARATAALERSLRLVARACKSRPLECDLRWSAWMSALHAGDPDAAATPFPASLSRGGRRDVDAALAAAVRVPALWLLAGLRAAELGARTVKLLHWLLVRLPAEGPALRALDPKELDCPCKPSAAFKVRVCAGSSLDARLRWRARGLSAFEAWASPAPCQLHALVCGGATTPVGVLSLTLGGALRRAHPGYGCGASRLGSRLRCVLKCDVAHHPELVERIGADAVVVRGLDLVRVRQLLVFSEPLPEGALAAWAARALKKRRLALAVAAILLTYLLVAAIVWLAEPAVVGIGDEPGLWRFLSWANEPDPPAATPKFSFWA